MMKAEQVSLLFAGDFAPCRDFEAIVLRDGERVFGDLKEDISRADLAFLNLETPLCEVGNPIQKDGGHLKASPRCIDAVVEAGFGLVGLANNHIMDYGERGLFQTMDVCQKAGLSMCGAGPNLAMAQKPCILERGGAKIAIVGVAEHEFSIATESQGGAAPLCPIDNSRQIQAAKELSDLVIVTIHGGNEYYPYPRPGLRKLCQFLVEHGADAVICHHPHVPGAYEFYRDRPIVYSLGNLIFSPRKDRDYWHEGYAMSLSYDLNTRGLIGSEVIPYTQLVADGGIRKMLGSQKEALLDRLAGYNSILHDADRYAGVWSEFCGTRRNGVLMRQYFPAFAPGIGKVGRWLNPGLMFLGTKSTRSVKRNMLFCESHMELLKSVVDSEFLSRR